MLWCDSGMTAKRKVSLALHEDLVAELEANMEALWPERVTAGPRAEGPAVCRG